MATNKNKPVKKAIKKPISKPKCKQGRKSGYNSTIAKYICDKISTTSKGLRALCKEDRKFPGLSTLMTWLRENEEFQKQYARAREEQADMLADEIIEIADKARKTTTIQESTAFGGTTTTIKSDNYNRSRLQIDARKWKASKLAPKKYGDKLDLTSDGKELNTQPVINLTMDGKPVKLS